MLIITCPACGIRADETEFHCAGADPWAAREIAHRGPVDELWQCRTGCRAYFRLRRHNTSQRLVAAVKLDEDFPE